VIIEKSFVMLDKSISEVVRQPVLVLVNEFSYELGIGTGMRHKLRPIEGLPSLFVDPRELVLKALPYTTCGR